MADREKVIKGMECCASLHQCIVCESCEYSRVDCAIDDAIELLKAQEPITGETSDGYHTFNELYHHRAVLFSVIISIFPDRAWKSKKHHDGTMFDGMFIVGIDTPDGQATYHYDIDPYWEMFNCRILDNAPEWDGHTPAQAIERIGKLKAQEPRVVTESDFDGADEYGYIPVWTEEKDGDMYWECIPKAAIVAPDGIEVLRYWTSRPTDEQREKEPWNG